MSEFSVLTSMQHRETVSVLETAVSNGVKGDDLRFIAGRYIRNSYRKNLPETEIDSICQEAELNGEGK